jgi:2-polyprenyl-3-methyl-5-hydroxy-6-metoxy-1,4-benzoquinol methylase
MFLQPPVAIAHSCRRIPAGVIARAGGDPTDSANGPPEHRARSFASHTLEGVRDDREIKTTQRELWSLGDYHKFATTSLWDFGPLLVEACGIGPGQRVLDVAAGTGNVAIRAAEAGAGVIASDLTPENFDAGRREASAHGVELEWVEADAEALPFADGEFDVVTSSVGAIFAPHHQTVADELLRVCRPGGTIGMIAIAPSRGALDLFALFNRYARRPLFAGESPLQWGDEEHVRELFGDRVSSLSLRRRAIDPRPIADFELLKGHHPVFVGLYRDLADQPDRAAALDRELADLVRRWEHDAQDLLVIVARTR